MHPASPSSRHVSRRPLRGVVAGLAAAATCLAGSLTGSPAAGAEAQSGPTPSSPSEVTAVQANIKSDLSVEKFQADVRTVLAAAPDVVTYNEVPLRVDSVLAPAGYALHRDPRNRYTKATAVAWRTDRWTMVDSGTFRISNYREVPPGRKIKLGLRFANWVTLQSYEGRTMSVVAAHVAPLDRNMPDLLRSSVTRVGTLVGQLAPHGPVLVGGDFNVHYKSSRYPRDLFDAAAMVPTYDTLGTYFPTGDHRGATIDYLFNRGAEQLVATQHRAVELYSDHDAVVGGFDWLTDTEVESRRVVSDPEGDDTQRRLAVDTVAGAVADAQPGESVVVVSAGLDLWSVFRKLRSAVGRGVALEYVTRSRTPTRLERRLGRIAEASGGASSVSRCRGACLQAWREAGFPRTFVLNRDLEGTAVQRIDATRTLAPAMVAKRTTVDILTGDVALEEGEEMLAQLR